ncbi:hypothetical protein ACFE04_008641 [Oxalis oulophora]
MDPNQNLKNRLREAASRLVGAMADLNNTTTHMICYGRCANTTTDELISYISEIKTQMRYLAPVSQIPRDLEKLAIQMETILHERYPGMAPPMAAQQRLLPPPSSFVNESAQNRLDLALSTTPPPPGFAVLQYQGQPNVPRPIQRPTAPTQSVVMPLPSSFGHPTTMQQQLAPNLPSYVYRPAPKVAIPISSGQLQSSMPYSMLTVQASTGQQSTTNATVTVSTTSRPSRTSNEIDSTTEPPRRYSPVSPVNENDDHNDQYEPEVSEFESDDDGRYETIRVPSDRERQQSVTVESTADQKEMEARQRASFQAAEQRMNGLAQERRDMADAHRQLEAIVNERLRKQQALNDVIRNSANIIAANVPCAMDQTPIKPIGRHALPIIPVEQKPRATTTVTAATKVPKTVSTISTGSPVLARIPSMSTTPKPKLSHSPSKSRSSSSSKRPSESEKMTPVVTPTYASSDGGSSSASKRSRGAKDRAEGKIRDSLTPVPLPPMSRMGTILKPILKVEETKKRRIGVKQQLRQQLKPLLLHQYHPTLRRIFATFSRSTP